MIVSFKDSSKKQGFEVAKLRLSFDQCAHSLTDSLCQFGCWKASDIIDVSLCILISCMISNKYLFLQDYLSVKSKNAMRYS